MRLLFSLLILTSTVFAEFSLTVAGRPATFKEAIVECQLHGSFLVRNLTLTFHNGGGGVAEGDLTYPLDDGEKIVSFAMDVNGVKRNGVVVPKKQARHAYETIVSRGVDPGLIEVNEVTNEFRTRVFPIPRNGDKTVWITTVQLVEEGEVMVWPKSLGRPKKWKLKLEIAGGEGGDFLEEQSGDASTNPETSLSWKPQLDLAYRSDHGDLHFARKDTDELSAELIEIWMDGTSEMSPMVAERLQELLTAYGDAKVSMKVFREDVSEVQEFTLRDGLAPGLIDSISGIHRIGMARPRSLPWKTVRADAVILITDGTFVMGRRGLGGTSCPLHVIDSGKGTSRWLRSEALRTGGGWHGPLELDPVRGKIPKGATMLGEVLEQWLFVKSAKEALKTPIANWLWAKMKVQDMSYRGVSSKEIDDFKFEHGVMDSDSSMIVMETARQYHEFGIEPPKDDEKLYQDWEALKGKDEKTQAERMDKLAELWVKRCERLSAPVSPLSERLSDQVQGRMDQLESIVLRSKKVSLASVHPLMTELLAIQAIVDDGIDDAEIDQLKKLMGSLTELEGEIELQRSWIEVVVGGQIKERGKKLLPYGSTLYDAVKASGGVTPFGATNRVKLYRAGKVYTYSLKVLAHQGVRLYSGDLVEVPEKNWRGNGGGGGQKTAPFSKEAPAAIAFKKGEAQEPKYYLEALAKVIDDEKKWASHYKVYRSACGWRADFYLNVINFLEDHGELDKALRVAGDLAEHMPENLEILRRAGRVLRRLGDLETAHGLFEHISEMQPDDAIALYDLARAKQGLGASKEAVPLLWKAVQMAGSQYTRGRGIVILEELNALLAKEKLEASEFGIDPRLVKHVPVELRAVLEWDAAQSNVDLIVRDPTGAWSTLLSGKEFASSTWWSGNVSKGYGPEAWAQQGLVPGSYHFGARFYGDWNGDQKSSVTAEIEFTRNFGTAEETRERRALRIEEKTHKKIMEVTVTPEGWE